MDKVDNTSKIDERYIEDALAAYLYKWLDNHYEPLPLLHQISNEDILEACEPYTDNSILHTIAEFEVEGKVMSMEVTFTPSELVKAIMMGDYNIEPEELDKPITVEGLVKVCRSAYHNLISDKVKAAKSNN